MTGTAAREGEIALVTGASSGIGRAMALQLAGQGWPLLLCGRRGEALLQVKEEAHAIHGLPVILFQGDLSRRRELELLLGLCADLDEDVRLLVNAAGAGLQEVRMESPEGLARQRMELNFFAAETLIRGLLPGMLKDKRGWILNVSSVAGLLPLPGHALYCASKHALLAFGEALSLELEGSGVSLLSLCPGLVHGEFFQAAGMNFQPARALKPEDVAQGGLKALFEGRSRLLLSASGTAWLQLLLRLPRSLRQRILARLLPKLPPRLEKPVPSPALEDGEPRR